MLTTSSAISGQGLPKVARPEPSPSATARSALSSNALPTRRPAAADNGSPATIVVGRRPAEVSAHWPRAVDPGTAICEVFQCAEIVDVWIDTIGAAQGIEPALVAVSSAGGEPWMLLPFAVERRQGVRVLCFLDKHISDYNAPVLFPGAPEWTSEEFAHLWQRILSALPPVDLVALEKMPDTVAGRTNPLTLLAGRPWPVSAHRAHLPADFATFAAARIKAPQRYQRYYRQLQKIGPVTYEVAQTHESSQRTLDVLFAQKQRRFAQTRVPGFDSNPGMTEFYREITARYPAIAVAAAVKCGEDVLATQWGLRFGQHYYYLISGYEQGAWDKYSPGRILNEAMLRWCVEKGLSIADFGIGDEPYKLEYCDEHVALHSLDQSLTLKGRLRLGASRALERLRATRIWQAARPYKWVVKRAMRRD